MKVSIVMPIYNSELYLADAINSILSQEFTDFELLLIDDCSTDSSPKICDHFSNIDDRVRVHHSIVNGGICRSRNIGLDLATGEYVAFCDDDDIYLGGLLKDNYEMAVRTNADMIKYGRQLVDILKDGTVVRSKETKGFGFHVYNGTEKFDDYYQVRSKGYLTNVWNGIYRLSIIRDNNVRFDESMRFGSEDMEFSIHIFSLASIVAINPNTYYKHFRRDASSTSRKFNENKIVSMVKTAEREQIFLKNMPQNLNNTIDKNRIIAETIRNIITIQLLHEDCPYTLEEKANVIRDIKNNPYFEISYEKAVVHRTFKIDKKSWLVNKLLKNSNYKLLLFILNLYKNVHGDRWV